VAGNTFVSAQVYNYLPVSYSDPETNPTITVSDRYQNSLYFQHQNSFSSANPLSISRVSISRNLEKIFCGTALTLTNSNFKNHTYNQYAIGFAYRNVIFNSVYLRLGVTGKLVQNNASPGYYDYFSFTEAPTAITNQFNGNLNLAAALSSSHERYYCSFSALNVNLANKNDSLLLFPKYYVMHAGNLASFFRSNRNSEISFTALVKKGNNDSANQWSLFMNAYYYMALSRSSGLLLGGRTGMISGSGYQFIPSVSLQKSNFMGSFLYSFFTTTNENTITYIPTFQINLNFMLWAD
jgi:hypothetical protein